MQAHVQHRGNLTETDLRTCPDDIRKDFSFLRAQLDQTVSEIGPDFNPAAAV